MRGRGIGRRFIGLLAKRAIELGFDEIWVRVLPTNAPALACYKQAGFESAAPQEEAAFNAGQSGEYMWRRLEKAGCSTEP